MALKILSTGEASGYDIIKQCGEILGKEPSSGTIYPTLKHLEDRGVVKSRKEGRRKLYSLTDKGREYIENTQELKRLYMDWLERLANAFGHLFDTETEKHLAESEDVNIYLMAKLIPLRNEIYGLKQKGVSNEEIEAVLDRTLRELKKLG